MNWPEAFFYSIVALCATTVVLYVVERYFQTKGR
jgi:hypothetical protein